MIMRGSKGGGRTGRAPPLFVGRNIFNTYHFCTGLAVVTLFAWNPNHDRL